MEELDKPSREDALNEVTTDKFGVTDPRFEPKAHEYKLEQFLSKMEGKLLRAEDPDHNR